MKVEVVGTAAFLLLLCAPQLISSPPFSYCLHRSELDDQEAFEALELEREAAERGGDSVPFFQAQKTQRATATQNHVALRQMHKNKRNH